MYEQPENTGVDVVHIGVAAPACCLLSRAAYGVQDETASKFDGGLLMFSTNFAGSFLLYRETVCSSYLSRSTLLRSTVSQSELKSCSSKNFALF